MTLDEVPFATQQRLHLIDSLLDWYGTVNRPVICDVFGLSTPQVSRDFQTYMLVAPANMVYDKRAKTYVKGADFKRVFLAGQT